MNRNDSKTIRDTEKKRLEQKKFMLQLKKDIVDLEKKIKHSRIENLKIDTIKNLKISARVLQLIAPYVVTAGLVAGGFTLLGDIPFYADEWKIYSNVMTEFDNAGNITTRQQYNDFKDDNGNTLDSSNNLLYYYSQWQLDENGLYSRIVQTYSIEKQTYENLIELFNKEDLKLEDVLGKPNTNIRETRNNLTDEEIQEESFIKAVIYNEETGDYIVHKETVGENVSLSILYILATSLLELVPLSFRHNISSFDFKTCVRRIKKRYPHIDADELAKKLELKKANYDRLTR